MRRVWVLVCHLPSDSALARAVAGDAAGWDLHAVLMASIHDRLAEANWQRGGGGRRPKPIPRPGMEPDRIGTSKRSTAEIASVIAALQPRRGGV